MSYKYTIATVLGSLILIGAGIWMYSHWTSTPPTQGETGDLEALATCLKEKGAKFYGAFWCPHCQEQKKEFGSAAKLLPYTECAKLNGDGQADDCKEANITSYPTWVFPNGERKTGAQSHADLAVATGCPVPAGARVSTPATVATPTPQVMEAPSTTSSTVPSVSTSTSIAPQS